VVVRESRGSTADKLENRYLGPRQNLSFSVPRLGIETFAKNGSVLARSAGDQRKKLLRTSVANAWGAPYSFAIEDLEDRRTAASGDKRLGRAPPHGRRPPANLPGIVNSVGVN